MKRTSISRTSDEQPYDQDTMTIDLPTPTRLDRFVCNEDGRLTQVISFDEVSYRSSVSHAPDGDDLTGGWWHAYLEGRGPEAAMAGKTLRTAELFSGPGGLALGFSQASAELGHRWRSMAAVDTDPEALAVYRRRNGTRYTSTDSAAMLVDYRVSGQGTGARFQYEPEIVDEGWLREVGEVDVLLAGPPCQGHSNLNNRTRRTDRRNELYLTVPAVAQAVRAEVVVIENVRAVIHDRKQVVQTAEALLRGAGYEIEQGVIKAVDLGWPQRRERYFIVARRSRSPISFEEVVAAIGDQPRDIMWAIGDLDSSNEDSYMTRAPVLSDENQRRIDWLFDNDEYDLALSERPDCHKDGTTYDAVYGRLHPDRPAPTITTGFMTPGRGRYIHPYERRVITAREAARLQGFPDDYDFQPRPGTEPSKAKLTKWIGDAVPMPLGYAATMAALAPGWNN